MPNGRPGVVTNTEQKQTGSIAHAAKVLGCLSNDINTVTDISRECNLGKSTVHRVLRLLEEQYLVVRDAINRRYYLGPLISQLTSNPVTSHEYLIMYADEEMKRLSQISEETVTLDILIGVQYFSLKEVPSKHDLKVTQEKRMAGPLYAGASIKVLLSQLGGDKLKIVMDNIDANAENRRPVVDKAALLTQLGATKKRGYAISHGERMSGVLCISVPIKNYILPVVLSVVGPEDRLRPRVNEVLKELRASAGRISNRVGGIFDG
jgi:DNA-binding IclR family transcriptional regulator